MLSFFSEDTSKTCFKVFADAINVRSSAASESEQNWSDFESRWYLTKMRSDRSQGIALMLDLATKIILLLRRLKLILLLLQRQSKCSTIIGRFDEEATRSGVSLCYLVDWVRTDASEDREPWYTLEPQGKQWQRGQRCTHYRSCNFRRKSWSAPWEPSGVDIFIDILYRSLLYFTWAGEYWRSTCVTPFNYHLLIHFCASRSFEHDIHGDFFALYWSRARNVSTMLESSRSEMFSFFKLVWIHATQSVLAVMTKHFAILSMYFRMKETDTPDTVSAITAEYAAKLKPCNIPSDTLKSLKNIRESSPKITPKKYSWMFCQWMQSLKCKSVVPLSNFSDRTPPRLEIKQLEITTK